MKKKLKIGLLLMLVLTISINSIAQHHNSNDYDDTDSFNRHRVSIAISHTHIPGAGSTAGDIQGIIVPSWGLNYDFWINEKWAIGSHNDMEISSYVVEEHDGNIIERERPVILTAVCIFKPTHHIELIAGFGKEFEKNHSFLVYRFGVEYEFELPGDWLLSPSLIFDMKEQTYSSWTLGAVIGKKF